MQTQCLPGLSIPARNLQILQAVAVLLVTGMLAWNPVSAEDSLENGLGMRFIQIPAGSFTMGTVEVEAARMEFPEPKPGDVLDETPAHTVRISEPFYLGETEVTQGVWYRVMENRPGGVDFWTRDVWEWVADWYAADTYVRSTATDPQGPGEDFAKVRRGGSYHCPMHLLRPGYRAANKPGTAYSVQGFRLVAERKGAQ